VNLSGWRAPPFRLRTDPPDINFRRRTATFRSDIRRNQKCSNYGRVGPRNFTQSLSQNRAGTSRFTRLLLSVPRLFHERASEQTAGVPG
jgi:hypothetical protein